MNQELFQQVVEIVAQELKVSPETITAGMSVGDVPQWGSMAQMAIITSVQNRFGVKIPMEDLFDLTSVGDLVTEVEKLKHA